jgi:transposase-like protein
MHMSSALNSSMNGSVGSSAEAVAEGARRATGETASGARRQDSEVFAIGRRRQFSGSEKRLLLAEADRRKAAGTLGAFFREKHIYSSMLSSWRKQLGASDRVALAPKRRGPKPDVSARQVLQLTRDNARLRRKLERAELIIDAQKKLCVALGLPTSDDRTDEE